MSTDAVILAGGRGSRLVPVTREFEKPLHVVEGRMLIDHARDFAIGFGAEKSYIISNPYIADRLCGRISPYERVLVQSRPSGICDAIAIGLDESTADNVLILCSDNLFYPPGEWFSRQARTPITVAVKTVDAAGSHLTHVNEFGLLERSVVGRALCWVGPVFADRRMLIERRKSSIEAWLNAMGPINYVYMNCRDAGDAAGIR